MIGDPGVPRRDAVLRPETMAGVISQRLRGGVPVEHCERTYVKYRTGESLRVVYRADGTYVAARTGKRDGIAAPEVGAALYPFPHDRKLDLAAVGRVLDEGTTPHLVAWAAEQSATFECRRDGHVVAYAKVQRDPAPWPELDAVRVPRVLAAADGVLLLEAIEGVRLDRAGSEGLTALGATLARLHATAPGFAVPRFARLDPARLVTAAEVIGRVRPDAAPAAQRLLARLLDTAEDHEPVLIHGDANLRNALLRPDGTVALLDLEDLSLGPAAADLGQLLAALLGNRAGARALLRGYGHSPSEAALRWHTAAALLARQALPAISRHRPDLLARLRELLDAGSALLAPKAVVA